MTFSNKIFYNIVSTLTFYMAINNFSWKLVSKFNSFLRKCFSTKQNYLHLSKLIIEPTPAAADNGVVYSNCFRRRTNHQSIANIAKATNLMLAHSPTYLNNQLRNASSNCV